MIPTNSPANQRIPSSEAVVHKDLKYARWPEWNDEELCDLTQDPLEQTNLVKSPGHARKLADLKKRLDIMGSQAP
jgi:hypothetical protein